MRTLVYFLPVIVLLVLSLFFYNGLKKGSGSELPSAFIGQTAPPLPETVLESFQGADLDSLLVENDYLLVNYFASWCGPCRAEHPILMDIKEMGVPIIGINYMDKPENAKKFVNEQGDPYVGIHTDQEGRVALDWGVAGVPETFVLNSEGKVVKRFFGPLTRDSFENELLPILNAS